MTFENLNRAQIRILLALYKRIRRCEGDIPIRSRDGKLLWCPACFSKFQRITELANRFQHLYELKEKMENNSKESARTHETACTRYWTNETDWLYFRLV